MPKEASGSDVNSKRRGEQPDVKPVAAGKGEGGEWPDAGCSLAVGLPAASGFAG